MKRPVSWPTPRKLLLQVHRDLLSVHRKVEEFTLDDDLKLVEKIVLVLEDRRFFRHAGVDLFSVFREIIRMSLRKRHGGASTIDMQFVRTATGYKEMTLKRKLYEALLALIIQQRYDKWQILRSYLACAYFGTRLTGIEKAALHVFAKTPNDLDFNEAAEIAAMLVYPRPSRLTERWFFKLERRKSYAISIYARNEKRFEKIPRREIF